MTSPGLTAVPLTATLVRGAATLEQTERGVIPHRLRRTPTRPQAAMPRNLEHRPSAVDGAQALAVQHGSDLGAFGIVERE